jgi:Zn-dependent protease
MLRGYRIGRLFGFPIELNLSFLILLGVVFLSTGGLSGVLVTLVGFASILLHELGHALMARHLGVRIAGIELQFFGGAAKMIDPPRSAGDEIAIAAAGPAVSFMLAGAGHGLYAGSGVAFFSYLGRPRISRGSSAAALSGFNSE